MHHRKGNPLLTLLIFQATEVEELNEMLTEAGDTFTVKEGEIEALKKLVAEYEDKIKQQVTVGLKAVEIVFLPHN